MHQGPGDARWLCEKGAEIQQIGDTLYRSPKGSIDLGYLWPDLEVWMFVGVRGTVVRTTDSPIDQINPWGWYRSTLNGRKNIYDRIERYRSSTISNWTSDRSCSLLTMDISVMEILNRNKHDWCWSMSDVPKVQIERASGSRLNWRRKRDLDTFGIWVLF